MKKTLITLAALAMGAVAQAGLEMTDTDKANAQTAIADQVLNAGLPTKGQTFEKTISDAGAFTLTLVLNWDKAASELNRWVSHTNVIGVERSNGWWKNGLHMFKTTEGDVDEGAVTALNVGVWIDHDGYKELSDWTQIGGTDEAPVRLGVTTTGGLTFNNGNATLDAASYNIDGKLALTYAFNGSDTYTISALKNDGTLGTITYTPYETGWDYANNQFGKVVLGADVEAGVIEHVVAFDRVLSDDEIIAVSKLIIPEPATATLSLLALVGLAARRRRK